jgi:hypothetical protein
MTSLLLPVAVGLLLGTALGLFGGGGGILAVPMLVGPLGMDVDQAATASLVIVLFGALGGLVSHHRAGRVLWRAGLTFGAVSAAGAMAGAAAAVRVPDGIKLAAFTVLMAFAGLAMLRNARRQPSAPAGPNPEPEPVAPAPAGAARPISIPLLVLLATGTGLVTGFLGVGGGFLVVPALVLSLGMPIANATATGLVVIAIASVSALAVRIGHADALTEPGLVGLIVVATVGASLAAARLSGRLSPRTLGTGFATLVLAMTLLVGAEAVQAIRAV